MQLRRKKNAAVDVLSPSQVALNADQTETANSQVMSMISDDASFFLWKKRLRKMLVQTVGLIGSLHLSWIRIQ